jgi:hypothetical protein
MLGVKQVKGKREKWKVKTASGDASRVFPFTFDPRVLHQHPPETLYKKKNTVQDSVLEKSKIYVLIGVYFTQRVMDSTG